MVLSTPLALLMEGDVCNTYKGSAHTTVFDRTVDAVVTVPSEVHSPAEPLRIDQACLTVSRLMLDTSRLLECKSMLDSAWLLGCRSTLASHSTTPAAMPISQIKAARRSRDSRIIGVSLSCHSCHLYVL